MGILSILLVSIVLGAVLLYITEYFDLSFFLTYLSVCFIIIGSFASVVSLCLIGITHSGTPAQLKEYEIQYESLVRRVETLDSDYEDVSKSDVIEDVADWNIDVENSKYWAYNPWTNWFFNKKVVDSLQTIDIDSVLENKN